MNDAASQKEQRGRRFIGCDDARSRLIGPHGPEFGKGCDFVDDLLSLGLVRDIVDDDVEAILGQAEGNGAAAPVDSAEAIVLRQFAELALIRCELRDEEKTSEEEAGISTLPLPSLLACVERGAFGSSGPDLPGGIWLPLKRLLKL